MKLPKSKHSPRKKLREEIGRLQYQQLLKERGDRCELSGKPANGLGRFHILAVGSHPRLEFHSENVLLVNWLPLHFWWHHDIIKAKRIVEPLIIELKGKDYREKLLMIEVIQPRLTTTYLRTLLMAYKEMSR